MQDERGRKFERWGSWLPHSLSLRDMQRQATVIFYPSRPMRALMFRVRGSRKSLTKASSRQAYFLPPPCTVPRAGLPRVPNTWKLNSTTEPLNVPSVQVTDQTMVEFLWPTSVVPYNSTNNYCEYPEILYADKVGKLGLRTDGPTEENLPSIPVPP